ncbi:DinB superfamily protein [Planctomycetes bacterium Pan216]|uniref:DinB superfamily protein n=2 Tax=Kolteria novifilia TaxID=2527975 RepID=A0A518BCT4_9BACT|nr:DinB superfamily protein [Planctomycetes bacterium Pan216]
MNAKDVLRADLSRAHMMLKMLLGDLSDEDLLLRAVPGCNHLAWQLGHLIATEHQVGEMIEEGAMPMLPAGFIDQHGDDTASLDDPDAFLSKEAYLELYEKQRETFLGMLDRIEEARLDEPSPERMKRLAPNIGEMFHLMGSHELNHVGQITPVRRKLGKPIVM